jgi:hypothetical protein
MTGNSRIIHDTIAILFFVTMIRRRKTRQEEARRNKKYPKQQSRVDRRPTVLLR